MTKYLTVEPDGHVTHFMVTKEDAYVVVSSHTAHAPHYGFKLYIDGNSNVIAESHNGNGKQRVSMHNGFIYDLIAAFRVLEKDQGGYTEEVETFKSEGPV